MKQTIIASLSGLALLTVAPLASAQTDDNVVLEMYQDAGGVVTRNGSQIKLADGMDLKAGDVVKFTNETGSTLQFDGCRRTFQSGAEVVLDELFCEGIQYASACGISADLLVAGTELVELGEDAKDISVVDDAYGGVQGSVRRDGANLSLSDALSLQFNDYITVTQSGGTLISFDGCQRRFPFGHEVELDQYFCDGARYLSACALSVDGNVPLYAAGVVGLAGLGYVVAGNNDENDRVSVSP